MKQLLFLLLFPCLALAQYPSNGSQKITLGEQTTADGLVWRGEANDTNVITPLSDTSAYIILDTVNNKFYHYNRTTTYWALAGGGVSVSSFSAGTTGLTPSTATTGAVTLGGTLLVANGGTGQSTLTANKFMVGNGTSGVLTPTNLHWDNTNSRLGIKNSNPGETIDIIGSSRYQNITSSFTEFSLRISDANNNFYTTRLFGNSFNRGESLFGLPETNNLFMYTSTNQFPAPDMGIGPLTNNKLILGTSNLERLRISGDGEVNIGYGATDNGAYKLQILDSVYVGGNVSASAYTTRSDYDLKDEIQNISYGINEVMQMQPVKYTYKSNGSTQLGFIAQDLGVITPEVVSFEDKMSVYYNALIPILTKAIQEQQALIKALEQRILTLENK